MKNNKIIGIISFAVITFLTLRNIYYYFSTYYVLISPLIPKKTIDCIAYPFLVASIICGIFMLVGVFALIRRKFAALTIICVLLVVTEWAIIEILSN
jgi:hypothetical protein